jgi:hypothetical protein
MDRWRLEASTRSSSTKHEPDRPAHPHALPATCVAELLRAGASVVNVRHFQAGQSVGACGGLGHGP